MKTRERNTSRLLAFAVVALPLAFAGLFLAGCTGTFPSTKYEVQEEEMFGYQEGVSPDELQSRVAVELGYSSSEIEEMEKSGMSSVQWERIVPAASLIGEMQKRYGVEFEASDIALPWTMESSWTLTCHATEGSLRGLSVTVRADLQGNVEDSYLPLLRNGEYQAVVRELISSTLDNQGVSPDDRAFSVRLMDIRYDQSISVDEPIGENLSRYEGSFEIYIRSPKDMSEEDLSAFSDELSHALSAQGLSGQLDLVYMPEYPADYDMTVQRASYFANLIESTEGTQATAEHVFRYV